jgi:hypothetical protein
MIYFRFFTLDSSFFSPPAGAAGVTSFFSAGTSAFFVVG